MAVSLRQLAEDAPRWNSIRMHEPREQEKILSGIRMTIRPSVACLIRSGVIGVADAVMHGARSGFVRWAVAGEMQVLRTTPPFVQLLFVWFAFGQFTLTGSPGG